LLVLSLPARSGGGQADPWWEGHDGDRTTTVGKRKWKNKNIRRKTMRENGGGDKKKKTIINK
jgi:hypothetical protein